jgi:hypothetical protein
VNKVSAETVNRIGVVMLLIAFLSLWGAWIPNPAVALRLNAFDMAEWSTVLMLVRAGNLHYVPDVLRLAPALCTIALALKAGDLKNLWARWGIRVLALLAVVLLMPQFPFWLSQENRLRFATAILTLIGIAISVLMDRYEGVRRGSIAGLSILAAGIAIYGFVTLLPHFAARYGGSIGPGWGFVLFVVMLIGVSVLEGLRLLPVPSTLTPVMEKQNGPAS